MISVKSEVEEGREEDRAGVGGGGGGDAQSAVGGEDGGVPMEEGLGESPPAAAAAGQASASQDRLGKQCLVRPFLTLSICLLSFLSRIFFLNSKIF